jgi:hypothetical protein
LNINKSQRRCTAIKYPCRSLNKVLECASIDVNSRRLIDHTEKDNVHLSMWKQMIDNILVWNIHLSFLLFFTIEVGILVHLTSLFDLFHYALWHCLNLTVGWIRMRSARHIRNLALVIFVFLSNEYFLQTSFIISMDCLTNFYKCH